MSGSAMVMTGCFGFLAGIFAAKAYLEGAPEWYLAAVVCFLIGAAG